MNSTKHDLSYDETKLDFQALLTTAEIAFAKSREDVNRAVDKLYNHPLEGSFYLTAQFLEQDAKNLTISAETLYTLRKALERHNIEIINKPEIPEEKKE